MSASDLEASKRFYEPLLRTLELPGSMEFERRTSSGVVKLVRTS